MHFTKATIVAVAALLSQGLASPLMARETDCSTVRSQCQSSGDPNESYCASLAAQCCAAAADKDACYKAAGLPSLSSKREQSCADVRSQCQSSGDPNEAECAAEAAQCCESAADKEACYKDAGLPSPSKRAQSCSDVRSQCQSSGDPNEAECAAEAAQCCESAADKDACLKDAGLPTSSKRAQSCSDVRSQCQSSGDPNEAECAAEAAQCCESAADKDACLKDAGLPTSSKRAQSCSDVRSQCQSSGDPNEAECAAEAAQCCESAADKDACLKDAGLPTSAKRAQSCADVRSQCQSSGDPNEAECAAEAAQCCESAADKDACYKSAGLPTSN